MLTVQLPSLERRMFLKNREFISADRHGLQTELLPGDDEVIAVLEKHFGLSLPAETDFGLKDS